MDFEWNQCCALCQCDGFGGSWKWESGSCNLPKFSEEPVSVSREMGRLKLGKSLQLEFMEVIKQLLTTGSAPSSSSAARENIFLLLDQ